MKSILFSIITSLFLLVSGQAQQPADTVIRIGLIADIQYCDCQTAGTRHYRESLSKLRSCMAEFNQRELDFIVDLGDRIDRDFKSFEPVETILDQSTAPVFFVPGNHDFSVKNSEKKNIIAKTGSKKGYYAIHRGHWKIIFLNGLENSILASRNLSIRHLRASNKLKHLVSAGAANAYDWNGGLGKQQTKWLERELTKAASQNLQVLIFCHQPIIKDNAHSLWDYDKLKMVLRSYPGEIYWINGHDHRGGFEQEANLKMITIHGMVEEDSNAYAIMEIKGDQVSIDGFGRQPDLHAGR